MNAKQLEPYSFSANPQKILLQNPIQLQPNVQMSTSLYRNVMHEQCVVRGNTNSINFHKKYGMIDKTDSLNRKPTKSKNTSNENENKEKQENSKVRANENISHSPENLGPNDLTKSGNMKSKISHQILNELKNRNVQRFGPNKESKEIYVDDKIRLQTDFLECLEIGVQTNTVLQKKLPNLDYFFKTGEDKMIQVIEKDIFNFDLEVEPIVHALSSRIALESLNEAQFELDLLKLKNIKDKSILETKAVAHKESEFFLKEAKKKEKQNFVKEEYFQQKIDAIKANKMLISRSLSKEILGFLNEDTKSYIERFGCNIDEKNYCFNGPLKDMIYSDVVEMKNRSAKFVNISKKLFSTTFRELLTQTMINSVNTGVKTDDIEEENEKGVENKVEE